jgi:hypothetical protein
MYAVACSDDGLPERARGEEEGRNGTAYRSQVASGLDSQHIESLEEVGKS